MTDSPYGETHGSRRPLRADALMLFAALIWGCSFVVQRLSLATIGPLLFTGTRFLLGAVVIALLSHWLKRPTEGNERQRVVWPWGPGALLGVLVALSIAAQQIGLGFTKVANAGFISSMYVVIVPLFALLAGQRLRLGVILGASFATVGLYYLSGERLTLSYGDGLELFGAVAIALQLILIGAYTQKHDPLTLALIQNLVCAALCLVAAFAVETVRWSDIEASALAILYCGAISVGVGYAIQAVAQKDAVPAHAAIIFSMEGVFAALSARIFLNERLTWSAIAGCSLVVAGCIASQLAPGRRRLSAAGSEASV